MAITALILDFDGTIFDTETPIFEEWVAEYRRHGQELSLSFWGRSIGSHDVVDLAVHLAELDGGGIDPPALREEVRGRVHARLDTQPLRRGVADLVAEAEGAGMPLAIASSSTSAWVERWLDQHGLRQPFAHVCGRDHVQRVKPEPDLFLLAAEKLEMAPAACLVFEDSPNGARAARRAGMPCVAVPNPVTRGLPMPDVELLLETLEGVGLAEILDRVAEAASGPGPPPGA